MSEKALFFNSLPDDTNPTGYDRPFNADDISDWQAVFFETGVVKAGLKVTAASGMSINMATGRAAIKGKGYVCRSIKTFTLETAPTGSASRYDYLVLKYDNNMSVRDIFAELRTGTSEIPTSAVLTRNENVYELMIAYIEVKPSATTIAQSNIIDTRGDKELCPWFTAVKGYDDYYDAIMEVHESNTTLSAAGKTVITDLPSKLYNEKYSLIEVYTNGIKEEKTAYTTAISGGYIVITFGAEKSAGAKITAILNNFLDGEGMSTALAQYTALLQDVTDLKAAGEYNYICNGVNDNVLISNLVKAYLQSGTDYGSAKFNIIGTIGMSAPVRGEGTTASPYGWFDFNIESNRDAIVDFSRCSQIAPTITNGTYNVIFHSNNDIHVIGANVVVSNTATDTVIRILNTTSGVVKFENCRFWITAYKDSLISLRGTFTNCRGSVANTINNSYCFLPASNSVVKIIGGEYYAYAGDVNVQSAIVGQSGADAVSILYGVSAPTLARSGFYQTNAIIQYVSGGIVNCTDLISELPLTVVSGISNIRGTIAKSKTNVW